MVFEYAATSPYELSIGEGETVKVLEEDDGSGWIKVAKNSGKKGLVPASYVEVVGLGEKPNATPRASVQYGASIYPHRPPPRWKPTLDPSHRNFSQFAECTIIRRRAKTRLGSRRGA